MQIEGDVERIEGCMVFVNVNTMMFAGNIMLWVEDLDGIQSQLNIWKKQMKDTGLRISKAKREVMVVRRNSELEKTMLLGMGTT